MDRRVRRSRQRLHEALVVPTLERGWDRVSVQAVCDRAGVGRSTFYVHFADKEDALVGGLEHVRDDLRAWPRTATFAFVRGLLEHADESRRLFRAVIGKRSGLAVQRRFREIVLELMTEELRAQRVAKAQLAVTSRFLAGALVELLFAWVDAREAAPAAAVERAYSMDSGDATGAQQFMFLAPLAPGGADRLRALTPELMGPRHADYVRARAQLGIRREAVFIESTAMGDAAVFYWLADDPKRSLQKLAASTDPFDVWLRGEIATLHPISLAQITEIASHNELIGEYPHTR